MSFVQKSKIRITKNNNNELLNKFKNLEEKLIIFEEKIKELENHKVPSNNNNNNKLIILEKKIKELENRKVPISSNNNNNNNNNDVKILTKIINNDINKLKIKIDKNENIIKKLLFN